MTNVPPDDETGKPGDEEDQTVQGQVRHSHLSARVPDEIGTGVFSNGVMILTGPFEIVLDFVLRMGEQQRVTARVVMPHLVCQQFVVALQDNIVNYEMRFGPLAPIPKLLPEPEVESSDQPRSETDTGISGELPAFHPENLPEQHPSPPPIEEIYDDLKLPDRMLSGRYANGVLIRHSATEFCFDFITNLYPRSAVSNRVYLSVPHIAPFLKSLTRALQPPGPQA
ncbi:DUF3467 domain-containing protein [Planctomicrobium sp. SH668]|uniref:DUF3467 domain-containing protein n=1 Tax=Planctomicrobium sp. SH668 TaxID=3448126 RepID=UPI003F5BACE8